MDGQNGLIYSFLLDGSGSGRALSWEEIDRWQPDQGTLWLHLDYGEERARTWLATASGLAAIEREALLEEETRPRLVPSGDGMLLILRGINFNPGADPEDMVALRMWFDRSRIITMRHRHVKAIEDIATALQAGRGPGSAGAFLVMVVRRITDRMGDVVADLDDLVDELEDGVLTEQSRELRSKLSLVRRQTISLRRYIFPQRDVLARIQHERLDWLSEMDRVHLREATERTARFVEDLDAARDRAAITQEELNNRLSEQMSRTMYILSLVAGIFLPLGLITGLLGINVGGIPGTDFPWAFVIVCVVLVVIAVFEYLLFKRKKLL
jgi:zinc transporter